MDKIAAIFFAIGGILGLYMLRFVFPKIHIPKGLALLHGLLMALGFFTLLTYSLTTENHHKHWESIRIFSVTILLGLIAIYRDLTHKEKNFWLILIHGTTGLAGISIFYLHLLGVI